MKANFTSKLNTIAKSFVFAAALVFIGTNSHAQAPLRGGTTYYIDGIGVDLVAPKDTFKNLSGTFSGTPYVTPYATSTGIMNALTLNGTDSTTTGQVTILLAPGYAGYVEPNLIVVGNPANGGYPYQGSNRPVLLTASPGYYDTITSATSITGASYSSMMQLNGIQFFTIDGQGTTGQRNITFKMSAASNSTNSMIINIVSPNANGSGTQYVTVKNCNFIGNSTSSAINTEFGIYLGSSINGVYAPQANLKTSQYITIQNNTIKAVQNGIYIIGKNNATNAQDRFLNINNNIIGGTIAPGGTANTDYVGGSGGACGIYLAAQASAAVQNNTISNSMNTYGGFSAIFLDYANNNSDLDSSIYINANKIYNITTTIIGQGSYGIKMNLGSHSQPLGITITNNIIGNISGPGYLAYNATNVPSAIMIQDASPNVGISMIHNSINMYGNVLTGAYGTPMFSTCLWLGPNVTGGVNLTNNILDNRQGLMAGNTAGGTAYAIIVNAATSPFSACDGNNYYVNTRSGGNTFIGYNAANGGTQMVSINHWRTFTTHDNSSFTAIPPFLSDTLLQLNSSTPSLISNLGISGTGVASDINGNTRPTSGPSCGAYQFTSSGGSVNIALVGGNTYQVSGTKSWPTAGSTNSGTFTDLSEAITYVNAYGVSGSGNIVLELQSSDTLEGYSYIPAIIDYPNQNANRPIYIKTHIGTTAVISEPNQLNINYNAVLRFIGARYVTVDGTNQNITILVPANATNSTSRVVAITPSSLSATTDITIKNCIITGNSTNSSTGVINTFAGIFAGGLFGNTSELFGFNNNHTFSNNLIQAVQTGIYMRGAVGRGNQDQNIAIIYNTIGGLTPAGATNPTTYIGGAASKAGIHLKGLLGSTLDGNIIRNCLNGYNDFRGIDLSNDNEVGTDSLMFIQNNKIYNLQTTSNGNFGIKINLGADTLRQITLLNNFIGKVTGTGFYGVSSNAANPSGISIATTSAVGHLGISMYYNTIQMSGSYITWSNNGSNCLWIGQYVNGGIIAQNNLFANSLSGTTGTPVNVYAIQIEGANKPFATSGIWGVGKLDYNLYSLGGINGTTKYIGSVNNNATTFSTLGTVATTGTWRNFSSQDSNSYLFATSFVSDTMPDVLLQAAGPIVNGAFPISYINRDIYATTRAGFPGYSLVPAGSSPCIGAVEFAQPYAKLVGGATYYINGTQNPPVYSSPGNGSFSTVNRAFQYINGYGVNSNTAPANPITLLITTGYIGEGDTLITTLADYPNMNANRYIVLKSDSIRTITTAGGSNGTYTANSSLIRFSGASYFVIDGNVNGTPRGLTFALPATASAVTTAKVIDFIPGSLPSTNVKIQNCNILGSSTTSGNNTFAGIYSGGITTPSNASLAGTNNNRFTNNFIGGVNYGIYLQGAPVKDLNDTINNNLIGGNIAPGGSAPTNYFGGITSAAGIFLSSQANTLVDSNVIKNNIASSYSLNSGIRLSNITSIFNTDSNITISRNIIYNLKTINALAVYGIYMNLGNEGSKKITIAQNWIAGISAYGQVGTPSISSTNPIGIMVDGSGTVNNLGLTLAFNSINLGASSIGTTQTYAGSSCVQFAPSITGGVSMFSNLLQNRLPNSSSNSNNFAVIVGANQNIFTTSSSNNYYSLNLNGASGLMAYNNNYITNTTPVVLNTISAIQGYTKQDTTSINFAISFISDTVLDITTASASVLVQRAKYNNAFPLDILKRFRGNPSTIGASEWASGTPLDSVAPRVYNLVPLTGCGGGPFSITVGAYSAQSVTSDTLYYTVNGGAVQLLTGSSSGLWTGSLSTKGYYSKTYSIPAQPSNSIILYRVSVNDNNGLGGKNGTYPLISGNWDTISTNISVFPYGYGFDGPNVNKWYSQQVAGTGGWILGSYGSTSNPNYSTAYSGVKMAMFPASTLPLGTVARLVTPCFDLTTTSLPTLRLWVTQNADLPNNQDSLTFSVSANGGPYIQAAGISRVNPNYIFPGWKQIDICLADYIWSNQVKIGIEGHSRNGNNIMIDSVMLVDNSISSPITPLVNIICHYDSLSLNIANSIAGVTYQMWDFVYSQALGNPYIGNGGSLNIKAPNPLRDSMYVGIYVINTLAPNPASCYNWMHDTAKIYTKLFKNGPFAIKGSPYTGAFYAGTPLNPDAVKVFDTLTYTILPPSGFTNADFGTKWTINTANTYVKAVTGYTASNALYTPPTSTTNGKYVMIVGTPDADSTFYMSIDFHLLPSNCDSDLIRVIKVTSVPLTAFVNDGRDTACRNAVVHFISTNIPNYLTSPYTYFWDFGDSTYSTNSAVNKVYKNAGTYTVKLTETNNVGLPGTVTKTFVVLPSPNSGFVNSKPCSGDTVVFTNGTTGGATNIWTYSSIFTPISSGSSTAVNPHFMLQAPGGDTGTFVVTLYAYNTYGCSDTTVHQVQLFAKPHASFTITNHCLGAVATIINNSYITGVTNSIGSVWNPGTGDSTFLSNNPTYRFTKNGTFTTKLIVTSNYGCIDSASHIVTIYDKPRSSFSYDTSTTCVGTNVSFTNGTTYSGGNNKILYRWDFGDQSLTSNAFIPSHSYGSLGNPTIILLATDTVNFCKDSTVKTIQINETPIAQFQATTKGCRNSPIVLTNKSSFSQNLIVNYLWNLGDGSTATTTDVTHTYTTAGNDTITLKATAISGCFSTYTNYMSISTSPVPHLAYDNILDSNSVRLRVTPSTFATYKYILDDGTGPYTAYRDTLPLHIYNSRGFHKVIVLVADNNGCTGVDSLYARTAYGVGISTTSATQFGINIYPNPFTDATNVSYNLSNTANVHIRVYDMLGRLVADIDNGTQSAGLHSSAINADKFSASSAAYLVRIQIDDAVITKQIIREK